MLEKWISGDDLLGKVLRFACVGGVSTVAYGVLTLAAVELLGLGPLAATVLGYLLVIPINFLLHRSFTFRSDNSVEREAPRFLLVHGGNIAASIATMYVAVNLLRIDYRWGVGATMTLVPVLMFLVLDGWVFRKKGRSRT